MKYTILFNFYFVLSPFLVVISENWGYYDLYSFLGMDSFGDLLRLLRSYFKDDYLPTKMIEFHHNTVKVIIYSQIDTCARLRIEKRNRGYTDRLIYLKMGLNALCLCQTFPGPGMAFQFRTTVKDRGMTRMKVKKRYMSGITVKLIIGPILGHHYYLSDRVVEERYMMEESFHNLFLRRVAVNDEMVEKLVVEVNDGVKPLSSLALREGALIGLHYRSFLDQIRGHVTIRIQGDYKKYSWTSPMHRFLQTFGLTNDNYMSYREQCWDAYHSNGHHFPVSSENLTIY